MRHFDPGGASDGTGIVFNDYDADAVIWAIGYALDLYQRSSRLAAAGAKRHGAGLLLEPPDRRATSTLYERLLRS